MCLRVAYIVTLAHYDTAAADDDDDKNDDDQW